jgi:nitrous oxidase accessory protein
VKLALATFLAASIAASAASVPVTSSISLALAQARDGDTVLVSGPGVFHEHVIITKSICLVGTNSPVIDADHSGTSITIVAPNVKVRDLMIRNSGCNLAKSDSGVMITGRRATVRECRIDNDAFGIYVHGGGNRLIEQNEIFGSTNVASSARGNGIHLWNTRHNRILGNIIHDKRDGMYFSYADDNLIADNRVYDTRFGIHYMYSHQNRLLTNSLSHNTIGATLMFSRQSLVEGNIVFANRRHGMFFKQVDNSRILNNIVAGQNRGFFIQQANQNRFEGNTIATNDIGIYLSNASEQNVFVGNAFIRNTQQVWQPPFETEQGRHSLNSFSEGRRGNYWSDYTGEDRNQDGIGDIPIIKRTCSATSLTGILTRVFLPSAPPSPSCAKGRKSCRCWTQRL